jgi:hypothetical protein
LGFSPCMNPISKHSPARESLLQQKDARTLYLVSEVDTWKSASIFKTYGFVSRHD